MDFAFLRQLCNGGTAQIAWIDGDERLRPKAVAGILLIDLALEFGRVDGGERACEVGVVRD